MTTIQEQISADGMRYAETNIQTYEWLQMLVNGIITQRQIDVLLCFYREPGHQGRPARDPRARREGALHRRRRHQGKRLCKGHERDGRQGLYP